MPKSIFDEVTVDAIRDLRVRLECGLMEARNVLKQAAADRCVNDLLTEGVVDPRLAELLKYLVSRAR